MGSNDFAPFRKINTFFIVQNICKYKKTIKIFNYPIPVGEQRDLLAIPGVGEADIRASLLKGEIRVKLMVKEIRIIESDIDLVQFNADQKKFLEENGIKFGLDGGGNYTLKQEVPLIGIRNGINRIFHTPEPFLNGTLDTGEKMHISVEHNGRSLYEGIDYTVSESGGSGTGFDTLNFISFSPNQQSVLYANYATKKKL